MPYFMTVIIFFKTFLDNKKYIVEEYGAFNSQVVTELSVTSFLRDGFLWYSCQYVWGMILQ